MSSPKLNPRQRTFANLYAIGNLSAVEAAVQAGYTKNTALAKSSTWLDNVGILQAIEDRQRTLAIQADYSTTEWRDQVRAAVALSLKAEQFTAAIKGYELLGRHIGALHTSRSISDEERKFATYLGAAMQRSADAEVARSEATPVESRVVEE